MAVAPSHRSTSAQSIHLTRTEKTCYKYIMRTQKQTDQEDETMIDQLKPKKPTFAELLHPNKKPVEFFPTLTHHTLDVDKMSFEPTRFMEEVKSLLGVMSLQISDDGTDKFEPIRHLYATDKEEGGS